METRKQKAFLKISLLFLLFAALVAVVTAVSYRSLLKAFYPMKEAALVERYADENGLDEALGLRRVKTESDLTPRPFPRQRRKGSCSSHSPPSSGFRAKRAKR